MKSFLTPGGQRIWLLDKGERCPSPIAANKVLRQAADGLWYLVHPKPTTTFARQPRDPKNGDFLARGSVKAREEKGGRQSDVKPVGKGATTARAKRKRAAVEARTPYQMSSGGVTQIPLPKAKGRKS